MVRGGTPATLEGALALSSAKIPPDDFFEGSIWGSELNTTRGPRARIADAICVQEAVNVTREQRYTEQLKEIGIYQPAFDPEIKMLAMMERELQRMVKAWKAAGSPITDTGAQGTPTSNKMLDAINSMRRDILAHRDALGLTPKGLHRLRPKSSGTDQEQTDPQPTVLELIRNRRRDEA